MNKDHGLAVGGFGRRGAQRIAIPAGSALAAPAPAARPGEDRAEEAPSTGVSRLRVACILLLIVPALLGLEAMLSGTSLITPIDPLFVNITWWIGFLLGIPLAALTVLNPHKPIGAVKTLLILFLMPFLSAFAGQMAAWRIADWTEFVFSDAQFTPATYPIKYASSGRKGRRDAFEIDPFNLKNATDIAVPRAQFEAIWPNHGDYCITVMQRRSASGAIQILNDGVFTLNEPKPALLTPCPGARAALRLSFG